MHIYLPGFKPRGKFGIFGAGRDGLKSCFTLTHLGYDFTINEKKPKPRGWQSHGITAFRQPTSELYQEIAHIVEKVVKI
ncbi:dihydropyrimidine dehydrogenase, partial [Salmonella enterica subsp. enterica serovar Infantis]